MPESEQVLASFEKTRETNRVTPQDKPPSTGTCSRRKIDRRWPKWSCRYPRSFVRPSRWRGVFQCPVFATTVKRYYGKRAGDGQEWGGPDEKTAFDAEDDHFPQAPLVLPQHKQFKKNDEAYNDLDR